MQAVFTDAGINADIRPATAGSQLLTQQNTGLQRAAGLPLIKGAINHLLQRGVGEVLQGLAAVTVYAGTASQLTDARPAWPQAHQATVAEQLSAQGTALIEPDIQRRSIKQQPALQLFRGWPVGQITQLRLHKFQIQLGTGA